MSTIDEFFTERGVAVDERLVVEALSTLLGDRLTATAAVSLPAADLQVLERHAGLRGSTDDESRAVADTVAAVARTVTTALTVDQAAASAGVSASRVRHWIGDGAVDVVKLSGRNLLPVWQFGPDGRPVPHLGQVLAALPADLHPLSVEGFFTTPEPELAADAEALAPVEWLAAGGDPGVVVELAAGLHHLL